MNDWFTVERIDTDSYIISEYKHWEETHCYLLNGANESLLIDTGMGIDNIFQVVKELTTNPIAVVATHTHWDHIGGHKYFSNFYVHEDEVNWIDGEFPLPLDYVKKLVIKEPNRIPNNFDINTYQVFQGKPTKILKDNDIIEFGGRSVQVVHTPGHAPGHMCFYEKKKKYLFTGDLIYSGKLDAFYPSTNPKEYKNSVEKIASLPVINIYPAHHSLDVKPLLVQEVKLALQEIEEDGKLKHGSGVFDYNNFQIHL
jgi:glyoxylase-like metal-dependent hydrolase (beta-lactamase superfamily II)